MSAVAGGATGRSCVVETGPAPRRIAVALLATIRVVLAVAGRFFACVATGATGCVNVRAGLETPASVAVLVATRATGCPAV